MEALLESLASGENSSTRALAAFILSNLGGTYSWTGETYTAAWLVRKAGLTSICHRNMIRNIDWLDPCLQVSISSEIPIPIHIIHTEYIYLCSPAKLLMLHYCICPLKMSFLRYVPLCFTVAQF